MEWRCSRTCLRVALLEVDNIAYIGATPCVDRLVVVTDHEKSVRALVQQAYQLLLPGRHILIFVDHQMLQLGCRTERLRVLPPQCFNHAADHQREVDELVALQRRA